MKRKIRIIILAIILIVLAGVYAIVDKGNSIYDASTDNNEFLPIGLTQGEHISQKFVTNEKSLDAMAAKMAFSGNKDGIIIGYKLLQENTDEVIAEGKTSLNSLKNGKFFQFEFEPRLKCKENTYIFEVMVEECDSDSEVLLYTTGKTQKETQFSYNNEVKEGTMVLRAITHRFDVETFIVTLCFLLYIVLFMGWLTKLFK